MVKSISFLLFLLSVGLIHVSYAGAEAPRCISEAQRAELNKTFSIEIDDPDLKEDLCDSSNAVKKLYDSLLFIQSIPPIRLNGVQVSPSRFLEERVKIIVFDPRCDSHVLAYTFPLERESQAIHVCPALSQDSVVYIAHALLHEARHMDENPHVDCNHGSQKDTPSCDQTYDERGSYGIGTEFLLNVAGLQSVPYEQRISAHQNAMEQLLERFNTLPLDIRRGALLVAENGDHYFLDQANERLEMLPFRSRPGDVTAVRSGQATWFNSDERTVKSYAYAPALLDTLGIFAKKFRAREIPDGGARLVDARFGAGYSCFVFETSLFCGGGQFEDQRIEVPGGVKKFFYGSGLRSLDEHKNYFSGQKGELYSLPARMESLAGNPGFEKAAYPFPVQALAQWGDADDLALLTDGTLARVNKEKLSRIQQIPSGLRFKQLIGSFYWSSVELKKMGMNGPDRLH